MRRAFGTEDMAAGALRLALGGLGDEPVDLPAQARDFALLPGDDVGEVVALAAQMGDMLFDRQAVHGADVAALRPPAKGWVAGHGGLG